MTTIEDPKLERLNRGALKREAQTIRSMIEIYCRAHHDEDRSDKQQLCASCQELCDYALARLARCPFGQEKPVCAKCNVHCYKPEYRIRISEVMRFAGPRIMFKHPLLTVDHLWKSVTVKAPEKPRNPKARKKEA